MSGVVGSTTYPPPNPLQPPCASPRFEKSYARRRGVRGTTPPAPLSCAMIFLCDLSRRAASSSPSPSPPGRGPFRVMMQKRKFFPVLRDDCDDNQKSPKALRVRSRDYRAADGFKPQSALHTPPPSTRFVEAD